MEKKQSLRYQIDGALAGWAAPPSSVERAAVLPHGRRIDRGNTRATGPDEREKSEAGESGELF
jgi:hypothetical protein